MKSRARLWIVGSLALGSLATAAPARAAEPDDRTAAAQVLFESGRSLLEEGHFAEACPKFAESQRLAPGIGTMLWLADCFESAGRLASGWAAFKDAAAVAGQRKDPRQRVAQDRAAALEPRLSRLNIIVGPDKAAPGLEVRRDGMVVGSAEWGLPVPLDPGVHSIAATAPGRRPWSTTVELRADAEVLPLMIPLLEVEAPAAAAPDPSTAAPSVVEPAGPARSGTTQRVVGLAIAGAGVVAVVVGAVEALGAKATYDDASPHCNAANQCDDTGKQDRSSAISRANVATVAFGVGAAALVGGGLVYFTAPVTSRTSLAMAPRAGGGVLRFDWSF
jgi:hypothetical protein